MFLQQYLHCLTDSSTTHQFEIFAVSKQKKCWKRQPIILKSALGSSCGVHVIAVKLQRVTQLGAGPMQT